VTETLRKEASEKFDVPISLLKRNTVKARSIKAQKLLCIHWCPLCPMHKVKVHVLNVILIHGAMRQPVCCAKGLALANSLFTDTVSHMQLIEWKKQHLGKSYREETSAQLGQTYWNNFCK
jgi:hypothetical protein